MNHCPCGMERPIAECCGRFHSGQALPASPEELMRSRYSAFCVRDSEYLIETHHPSQHQSDDREHLTRTMESTEWLGLRILESTLEGNNRGEVEFVAFYRQSGEPDTSPPEQLHERSTFVREDERWYYLDGEMLPPLAFPGDP